MRRLVHWTALFSTIASALIVATAPPVTAWTKYTINPCTPDSTITCDNANPHQVYTPTSPARNQLVVFFGGTNSAPSGYDKISESLAGHGYHVVNLRYVNDTAVATLCPNSTRLSDPECHRKFRSEGIWGENTADPRGVAYNSSAVTVSAANSVANRLLELVDYLATTSPYSTQGWAQFRDTASFNSTYGVPNLVWSKVAMAGHSQGSGVGLYVGKFYDLLRVAVISGPQDNWEDGTTIYTAPWITEGGFASPASDMYGFGNDKDSLYQGQLAAWAVLSLPGSVTSVSVGYPYGNSHRLLTTSTSSLCAHSSTATDGCTPGNPPTYAPVWHYMVDGG